MTSLNTQLKKEIFRKKTALYESIKQVTIICFFDDRFGDTPDDFIYLFDFMQTNYIDEYLDSMDIEYDDYKSAIEFIDKTNNEMKGGDVYCVLKVLAGFDNLEDDLR